MKKTVSYIFPIYNEEGNIDLLYATMSDLIKQHPAYNYELIFVNDGSRDSSLAKLIALQAKDDRIRVINFSRNYGHQLAVTAGLDYAQGDAVIIMDSDMQDPPKVSFELIKRWEEGYDVVYAQRRTRKDTLFKRFTAHAFYLVLQKLADIDIPRNTGDFRLLDRRVVDELNRFREHDRFLRGLVSYVGFKQIAVQFDRDRRHAGTTGYPLKKMIRFAADGIIGFSAAPLKIISNLGYVMSALSFLAALYALAVRIFEPSTIVPGWTFTVIAMSFMGGVQLVVLGVLGSYIGRIYTEVKGRPLYTIASIHEKPNKK